MESKKMMLYTSKKEYQQHQQKSKDISQNGHAMMAAFPLSNSYGQRASVAGPVIWNWLPDSMRDPAISRDSFRRSLKTFYFQLTCVHSALELSGRCALQIYLLTYLLTLKEGYFVGLSRREKRQKKQYPSNTFHVWQINNTSYQHYQ